jgi:hypothetical protein
MINAQTSKEVLVAIGALLLLVILGLISRQGRWRWSDGRERRGGRFRSALWATRLFYEAIGFLPIEVFPTLWDPWNPRLLMLKRLLPENNA